MKVRSLVLVSAALILSAASCIARQEAPADGSSNSVATALAPLLDQAKIIAGLNEVTRDAYPDAESVLVSEHARTEYLADGGFVTLDEDYEKILTESGREAAEREFSYNVFYGGLEIIAAEVIKADGRIVKHDPASISKEQVDRSQMEANIYDPNDKVTVAALPDVEIGDTIRFFVKRWESRPRMNGCYSDWVMLESEIPMRSVVHEYIAPKDHPLRSRALLGENKGTVTSTEQVEGDRIRYVWTGRDIPQAFPEPSMPSLQAAGQRLLVSTVGDWKEISRWYHEICKGHLAKITPGMKAKTRELTSKAKNDREKIEAIFKFVSQEIRYMGITTETESPGYEPHDVNITFENRYGVCRDKAALLAAMLNEAGIPAFPVIIMVGEKLDREVPSASFNHAITAARGKDGTYVLMDSTDESTANLMPEYLFNRSYLVATPEGETLMTSPVSPVEDNMAVAKTEVTLEDDGSATGTTVVDMTGINDVAYRGQFAGAKPDLIRRYFEGAVKSVVAGATVTSFKLEPEDMQDASRNLRFSIGWSVPNILVTGGDAAQLELPFVGYSFGEAVHVLGDSLQLDRRRFPLHLDLTCGTREELSIKLPPTLAKPISLPQYQNTDHKDFSFTRMIGVDGGVLKASIEIRLKSPSIEPAAYLELKQAMAMAQENRRQQPVFERHGRVAAVSKSAPAAPAAVPATSDVEILRSVCDVRVENASTWTTRQTVKKRILNYGGMKTHSEIKVDFNPVWEDVKLEYARVRQKDGVVRAIQPQEINTLDAAWVASAPRYPGARTLVVSLPGVEAGAVVEYAIRTAVKNQPMFSCDHAFSSPDAVRQTEFTFDLPERLNPQIVMDFPRDGHLTDNTAGGRRKLRFTWRDIKPQAAEAEAPPEWVDAPDFAMSTGNWSTYAVAVGRTTASKTEHQPASTAKAAEIVAGLTDPMAKLTAIRDFVARQIRRVDVGFTAFPLAAALSPADVTLKDGYGHDADRAILLHTMLKAAGFESELALASSSVREPTLLKRSLQVPENGVFDGLVCRVKDPNHSNTRAWPDRWDGATSSGHSGAGDWLPLDLLSQYAPVGATWLDHQPGLRLDGTSFTWKAPWVMDNSEATHMAMEIDADGNALITCTKVHSGTVHEGFVARYCGMTPEERKREFQGLVSGVAQNATPVGDLVTDFTYPGKLAYTVRVPRYAVKDGSLLYFDLPEMPENWIHAESNTRQRPFLVSTETRSTFTWNVTLPGGLKPVIQPQNYEWTGPANLGTAVFCGGGEAGDDKTCLDFLLDIRLHPALVPTSDYPNLLDLNRHFSHASARRVLLE